uniref:Hemagglutinin glycoprotein n=1 Tax=Feline morbillivirus TaxID=1170234 RepID=A0A097ZJ49_9MONO|nr:hemagglutinin protein [Feline morbillivirus]
MESNNIKYYKDSSRYFGKILDEHKTINSQLYSLSIKVITIIAIIVSLIATIITIINATSGRTTLNSNTDILLSQRDEIHNIQEMIFDRIYPLINAMSTELGLHIPTLLDELTKAIDQKIKIMHPPVDTMTSDLNWCIKPPNGIIIDPKSYCESMELSKTYELLLDQLDVSRKKSLIINRKNINQCQLVDNSKIIFATVNIQSTPRFLNFGHTVSNQRITFGQGTYSSTYVITIQEDGVTDVQYRVFEIGYISDQFGVFPSLIVSRVLPIRMLLGMESCTLTSDRLGGYFLCMNTLTRSIYDYVSIRDLKSLYITIPHYGKVNYTYFNFGKIRSPHEIDKIWLTSDRGQIISGYFAAFVTITIRNYNNYPYKCLNNPCFDNSENYCRGWYKNITGNDDVPILAYLLVEMHDEEGPLITLVAIPPYNYTAPSHNSLYYDDKINKLIMTTSHIGHIQINEVHEVIVGDNLEAILLNRLSDEHPNLTACRLNQGIKEQYRSDGTIISNSALIDIQERMYITIKAVPPVGNYNFTVELHSRSNTSYLLLPKQFNAKYDKLHLECFSWDKSWWCALIPQFSLSWNESLSVDTAIFNLISCK